VGEPIREIPMYEHTVVKAQPPQQAPPIQRLRMRYARRGRMRFASHRDFARAFQRAVLRAELPVAYSSGFNPHPRISYAGATPTGAASEAEYLEVGLAVAQDPDLVRAALTTALPEGLEVLAVVEATPGALADLLEASRWLVEIEDDSGMVGAIDGFLAAESVHVERMTKKGRRQFDCREPVVRLVGEFVDSLCRLDLVLAHRQPAVRPDDVLVGLARFRPQPDDPDRVGPGHGSPRRGRLDPVSQPCPDGPLRPSRQRMTRLAQGILRGDELVDPFG
jgi:radical SAM-linked protein